MIKGKGLQPAWYRPAGFCIYKPLYMNTQTISSQVLFAKAIECGFLSNDVKAKNYAGNYMYIGVTSNMAQFKHIHLRSYINISLTLLNDL